MVFWSADADRHAGKLFLIFGLFLLSMAFCGCGGGSNLKIAKLKAGEENKIPKPKSKVLYVTAHNLPLLASLDRNGSKFELPLVSEFELFSKDILTNLSDKDLRIEEVPGKAYFQLKPSTKMELDRGFLILHNGKARFEFKKVDGIFRIRLPQATLGILGTTLDVEVSKDGASQICLLEGIIEIKSSSGNITLKQGNLITISAGGTISAPQKLPDLNQGTVHPR